MMGKVLKTVLAGLLGITTVINAAKDPIRMKMEQMTLDEKIGMLFVIRPEALYLDYDPYINSSNSKMCLTQVTEKMKQAHEDYPVGGFVLFKKNILNPKQLMTFTEQLHSLGDHTPLICIDEEGGSVARIGNHDAFDVETFTNMQFIANSKDPYNAYYLGRTIGSYLHEYGIDLDFAPVADVNTNPKNPIIGVRAFGSDPVQAGEMVKKVIEGLHEEDVFSCIKHFPGHGDTKTDTHLGFAQTLKTWDEMLNCEMIPFIKGIEAPTDLIMIAHITAPKVDPDNPASLSYIFLTEKLRGELHYEGVIITDALEMGAISKMYSSAEACVKAIKAGADILLMPLNYVQGFEAIKKAVQSGEIPMERIDESVYRILKLRQESPE